MYWHGVQPSTYARSYRRSSTLALGILSFTLLSTLGSTPAARGDDCLGSLKLKRNTLLVRLIQSRTPEIKPSRLESLVEQISKQTSLTPHEARQWLYSHFYFDRDQIAQSPDRESLGLTRLWGPDGKKDYATHGLDNYLKARALHPPGTPLTHESIKAIHRTLMSRLEETDLFAPNVDGMFRAHVGVYRYQSVGLLLNLNTNPHYAVAIKNNPFLHQASFQDHFILYADPEHAQQFKKYLSPEMWKKISAVKDVTKREHLSQEMVKDLMTNALNEHQSELSTAKSLLQRIKIHAEFAQRMVNIHPFMDGNGRTARFILGSLLEAEGLLPPILRTQNDAFISSASYVEQVREGILATQLFLDDIHHRLELRLDPLATPITLYSVLPERVSVDWGRPLGKRFVEVDPWDYAQFIRIFGQAQADFPSTENRRLARYVQSVKARSVLYAGSRTATTENPDAFFLGLVPNEAITLRTQILAGKPDHWHYKADQFYDRNLIHRGLSFRDTLDDDALLSHFVKRQTIHHSMRSNSSLDAKADMAEFNEQLALKPEQLLAALTDHVLAQGSYTQGLFASASKNRATAERFSQGFLMNDDHIKNIKSQLILSALTPRQGSVDINRLSGISKKLANQPFRSRYPRQEEVAVAGGIDPDSVMRLEFRDVVVESVEQNTGQNIAGKTTLVRTRIVERSASDPNMLTLSTFGADGVLLSTHRYRIEPDARLTRLP